MNSNFLPKIDKAVFDEKAKSSYMELYDLLANPLHEELYRRQTFEFVDDLSAGQQLVLIYDYIRGQVGQGGFIQFIENGYVILLKDMPAMLTKMNATGMAQVLDDVLKVYVLNHKLFHNGTSLEEFAKLYGELKEFEEIEERFNELVMPTLELMMQYAIQHPEEFVDLQ